MCFKNSVKAVGTGFSLVPASWAVAVDLDGTLIEEESHRVLWRYVTTHRPGSVLGILKMWVREGPSAAKEEMARLCPLEGFSWTMENCLLETLQKLKEGGTPLILITGAPAALAQPLAKRAGVFTHVLHSTRQHNLVGRAKLKALRALLGDLPFVYVGNSLKDLFVWQDPQCRQAWIVRPSYCLKKLAPFFLQSPLIFP
jgi:phosphoserine phosphatase